MIKPNLINEAITLQLSRTLGYLRLKEISTANGYHTELNEQVYRGRVIFGENDPLPLASILEVPIPLDQTPSPTDSEFSHAKSEVA